MGLVVGLYAFLFPPAAVLTLIIVAACWALFTGILQIVTAIALRKELANEWMLILGQIGWLLLHSARP